MSFVEVLQSRNGANGAPPNVGMTATSGQKQARAVSITLRPSALPRIGWLKLGEKVRVFLGAGEHGGLLRIERGGTYKLFTPACRKAALAAIQVRSADLAKLLPLAAGAHAITPCAYKYDADWIEIALPVWARAAPAPVPVPGPVPVKAFTPAKPDGFKGLLAGGLQGAAGVPSSPIPLSGGGRRG